MLDCERIEPRKLAYDRPSFKFLNFLKKYYGLNDYVPQNNNFVVFNDYFKVEQHQYTKQSYSDSGNCKQNMFGNVDRTPVTYSKTAKQQQLPQQQPHTQATAKATAQYGNANNVHRTNKMPLPPYQYAKTSSEYGAFLNYGDF